MELHARHVALPVAKLAALLEHAQFALMDFTQLEPQPVPLVLMDANYVLVLINLLAQDARMATTRRLTNHALNAQVTEQLQPALLLLLIQLAPTLLELLLQF